ncbi:hypothetical protein Tco_0665455 [Tanacetum coccineum]
MATSKNIKYAPQVEANLIVELWFTDVVDHPKLTTYASEQRPLKEFIIKFTVKNGNTPLSFNFKTFVQTTGLDYNNGHYEAIPLMEVIKVELLKLGVHNDTQVEESASDLVNRTPLLKTWFPTLLTRAKIDIGKINFNDLVTRLIDKPRKKYVAYPRFLSCVLKHLLGSEYTQDKALGFIPSVLSKLNYHRNSSEVPPIELMKFMLSVVKHQALVSPTPSLEKVGKKKKSQTVTPPKPKS